MTELLYLRDAEQRSFDAGAVSRVEGGLVLDRTAFYVTGGGQPHDTGTLAWDGGRARVVDVRKDRDTGEVVHVLDGDIHVVSTAQVGRIRVVKTESKGKGNKRVRIEVLDA